MPGSRLILTGTGQEVTLNLEMSEWDPEQDNNPLLGAFQATVDSSGYTSGSGTALIPLGWPNSPELGAFQILTYHNGLALRSLRAVWTHAGRLGMAIVLKSFGGRTTRPCR